MVFAGLVSTLWPLATLYSFPYMEHEHNGRVLQESPAVLLSRHPTARYHLLMTPLVGGIQLIQNGITVNLF